MRHFWFISNHSEKSLAFPLLRILLVFNELADRMTMLSKAVIKGGDEKHVNQSFVYTSLEHTLLQLHYDIFFSQICKNLLALFWTKSLELILWFFWLQQILLHFFHALVSASVLRNEFRRNAF